MPDEGAEVDWLSHAGVYAGVHAPTSTLSGVISSESSSTSIG